MKRRTELKLESMKIFSKKYIFSSRFIVRNTLAVLVIGTVVGGSAMTANLVDSAEVADNSAKISSVFEEKASKKAYGNTKDEVKYVINLSDDALIEDTSVNQLYTRFSDEGYLVATNEINKLSKSEYDMTGKYIVKTDGLNLREKASEDSEVIGVLNTGDSGEVVGTKGDWTIVATNDSKGYVKSKYIITGNDATKIAKQAAMKGVSYKALLTVDDKPVVVASANKDDTSTEVFKDTESTTESFDTEESTKVSTEAPSTDSTTEQATTEAPTEEPTTEEPTTEAPTEEPTTEEPTTEAPTEEPTTEEPTTEAPTEEPTTETPVVASSDLNLLAAIVYAEAGGEGYEGQLAVAAVIMNRLANGYWGSTLSDVIYAPGQFTGVYCDSFTYALSNPDSSCLAAASAAMGGATNLNGNYMYFLPTWAVDPSQGKQVIGNHVFW